jgi:hypothetical protein
MNDPQANPSTATSTEPARELKSDSQVFPKDSPRGVVASWLQLARSNKAREAEALTTKVNDLYVDAERLKLPQPGDIRVQRSLGSASVAAVLSNTFEDDKGRQRRCLFWLMRRDGRWLIHRSVLDEPDNIHQQLLGFLAPFHPLSFLPLDAVHTVSYTRVAGRQG